MLDTLQNHLATAFQTRFALTPTWFRAPGRINLIGEHTDYNEGFVFPAAIRQAMIWGVALTDDGALRMYASDLDQEAQFQAGDYELEAPGWARYLQAICVVLKKQGYEAGGVAAVFGGNIPIGAGLSSSAAMGCGFIYALSALHNWGLTRIEVARLAQAAEHHIGANVGIMDQFAVLHGVEGHAIRLDCRDLSYTPTKVQVEGYQWVLINTKVEHELAGSAYNDRRESCERVVAHIQQTHPAVSSLRDVNTEMLETAAPELEAEDLKRARYILAENERVQHMAIALEAGDIQAIGTFLYGSHKGLSEEYEVSCKELDVLVELAKKESAVAGARMMGGGFGGCTLNLIKSEAVEEVSTRIMTAYQEETGLTPEQYIVDLADGVSGLQA